MIHAANIVHETLDGETIVIHLDTGSYYSLTGSGAEIWELVGVGAAVSSICAEVARRHGLPVSEITEPVETFIADLETEGLVEDSDTLSNDPPLKPNEANGPWELPKLERFDDMRNFLLVDPIHQVDQTGWPNPKTLDRESA